MGTRILSAIFIFLYVIKCSAISHNELEEFAEYLAETSQLSPTFKKGGEPNDYDEDEIVSDHAWEDSGKFEGDLILNDRQRRLIVQTVAEGLARNGVRDSAKRWPNNEVIYYIQVEHFTNDQVQAIQSGIEDLAQASCIQFRPYKKGDRDAVVIQGSRRGCFSQVGFQGGYQVLNLSGRHPVGRGCFRHGTVVHELLHTLGFYHMQSSPDRDDYVDVVWDNILRKAKHNFRKYNLFSVSDFGVGYDYDSVLHYSRRAFSSNGQDTIVPKQRGAQIGQRRGLSDKDAEKLNKMYCDANSDNAQADEESDKNKKKKTPKNKPFEGHGIGYHQGKAVAIKLSPEAETYKLGDVHSSHVFDYFSKTPQILSPKQQGFYTDKKVANSYDPSGAVTIQNYKGPANYNTDKVPLSDKNIDSHSTYHSDQPITRERDENYSSNDQMPTKQRDEKTSDSEADDIQDPSFIDALDRISNIIKSRVYPSQTPDLSIYKKYDQYSKHNNDQQEDKKDKNDESIAITPYGYNKPQRDKLISAVKIINNLFDIDSYQSHESLEDPAAKLSDYNKKESHEKKLSEISNIKDHNKYIPYASYLHSDQNEKDDGIRLYPTHAEYNQSNKHNRYLSTQGDSKRVNDNSENSYPALYESAPYKDYIREESVFNNENRYSPFTPTRFKEYSYVS